MPILLRMKPTIGTSHLRRGRVSEPGRIYLITCVAWNRAPVFRPYLAARMAARIIHDPNTWRGATCLTWVLMPDHFHGLIQLDEGDLSKVVSSFKSRLSRAFRAEGRKYPLWQKAFHDRALRRDEDMKAVARYIVANPIRAGLASNVGDYPYWDAVWI